jgi:hypothetical protein
MTTMYYLLVPSIDPSTRRKVVYSEHSTAEEATSEAIRFVQSYNDIEVTIIKGEVQGHLRLPAPAPAPLATISLSTDQTGSRLPPVHRGPISLAEWLNEPGHVLAPELRALITDAYQQDPSNNPHALVTLANEAYQHGVCQQDEILRKGR